MPRAARTNERTAVLYVTDKNYHDITEISVASVALMHKAPLAFHVTQFEYERPVSPELIAFLSARDHTIECRPFMPPTDTGSPHDDLRLFSHITRASLYKGAAIEELALSYRYIAYIDSDVVAFTEFDFNDYYNSEVSISAVYDFVTYMNYDGQDISKSAADAGFSADYFNSGVMLINSARWKADTVFRKYLNALSKHDVMCPYRRDTAGKHDDRCQNTDQCAFNMALNGAWFPLRFEMNVQKPVRHTTLWQNAILRHYTGPNKINVRSNRVRDRREAALLKRIKHEVPIQHLNTKRYCGGFGFAIDAVRLRRVTLRYKNVINVLRNRYSLLQKARLL
jgi:lipopolysaccharide biosynthesis glycosyltransferase